MQKKLRKKKVVPKPVRIRRLKRRADAALSDYARELAKVEYQGNCPLCGKDPTVPVLNKKGKVIKNRWICFHFVRRRCKSVRWDLSNVIGACEFCNLREKGNPDTSRAWFIRRFGVEKYLRIVDKSAEPFEPDEQFLADVVQTFKTALSKLKGEKDGNQDAPAPAPDRPVSP